MTLYIPAASLLPNSRRRLRYPAFIGHLETFFNSEQPATYRLIDTVGWRKARQENWAAVADARGAILGAEWIVHVGAFPESMRKYFLCLAPA
jgi:hypothetical protein